MRLVKKIMTKNPCYTCGRTITVRGLTLHSVGCSQPTANVFISGWNSPKHTTSCVHAFIDGLTGVVYQTLPWSRRGWHVGRGSKGSYNDSHIGVEMCEPDCISYTGGGTFTCSNKTRAREIAKRTYNSAVELFAFLCKKYKLNPLADGVIVSHNEAHTRGYGSNHGDPEHLWRGLGLPYTMNTFRKAVAKEMGKTSTSSVHNGDKSNLYYVRKSWGSISSQIGAYRSLEGAKKVCKTGYSVFNDKGKVVYTRKKAASSSLTAVAKKVIAGEYGNGIARKKRLEEEGYDYDKVQAEVKRLLK